MPKMAMHAGADGAHQSRALVQVLAVGLTAFYGGMLDLLRVFYVLTACLIPLDIYQMIWGKLGAASLFLVILAVLARGAACWFGYQACSLLFRFVDAFCQRSKTAQAGESGSPDLLESITGCVFSQIAPML